MVALKCSCKGVWGVRGVWVFGVCGGIPEIVEGDMWRRRAPQPGTILTN